MIQLPKLTSTALAAIGILVTTARNGTAAEYNVPGNFPKIQAALDAAVAGDVIRVGPGTYLENLDFKFQGMTNLLTLRADKVSLKVSATDASGNVTVTTQHLTLSGQKDR
jgi:hypothetical protein